MMDITNIFDSLKDRPWLIAVAIVIGLLLLRSGKGGGGGYDMGAMLESQRIASDANIAMAQIGAERSAAQNAIAGQYLTEASLGAMAYAASNKSESTKLAIAGLATGQAAAESNAMYNLGAMQQSQGFATSMRSLGIMHDKLYGDYLLNNKSLDTQVNLANLEHGTLRYDMGVGKEVRFKELDVQNAMDERYTYNQLPAMLRNNIDAIWHQGRAQRNIVKAAGTTSILNNLIGTAGNLASTGMSMGRF